VEAVLGAPAYDGRIAETEMAPEEKDPESRAGENLWPGLRR
jgi:hypothetical protein